MKHFHIIANKRKDSNLEITEQIRQLILSHGAECGVYDQYDEDKDSPIPVPEETECILVVGGDGTILDAVRRLEDNTIPLLGVNLGTLGFLADIKLSDFGFVIEHLLNDHYQVEKRLMIRADVYHEDKIVRSFHALNDVNINRVGTYGPINLNVSINGYQIDSYHGDGIIVCTPTGSTGYNLSAGGPIINPTCRNFVLTPICSHSLTARPIVLSKDDQILIEVESMKNPNAQAMLCFDGREGFLMDQTDYVKVYKSDKYTPFVKMHEVSFVDILKEKLL